MEKELILLVKFTYYNPDGYISKLEIIRIKRYYDFSVNSLTEILKSKYPTFRNIYIHDITTL